MTTGTTMTLAQAGAGREEVEKAAPEPLKVKDGPNNLNRPPVANSRSIWLPVDLGKSSIFESTRRFGSRRRIFLVVYLRHNLTRGRRRLKIY
jgi:hypothetical protein